MDLREIVRAQPGFVVGHQPVAESLNLRNETRLFRTDPLASYMESIRDRHTKYFRDDVGRYLQGFAWYSLCLKRTLEHCSVARRWYSEVRLLDATAKYSVRQKAITAKQREISPYQDLDYQNLIIHACILLDRSITLSRRFLSGNNLPSFTSFSKHKDFLKKHADSLHPGHREYADHVVTQTDWFEIPLRVLRDKYLMHSSERHADFFGWSGSSNWDLEMITMVENRPKQEHPISPDKWIIFTPRRLARDMESFLRWFADYAMRKSKESPIGNRVF
jgi:hypothetical protein